MEKIRKHYRQQSTETGGSQREKDPSKKVVTEKQSDDDCRCKEVSEKTSSEMLRLMLNDLAFWKRGKKRK